MVKNTTAEVLNGAYNPKNWNYFVTGKTGIKYLKSPFLSNKKMTTLIINIKLLQVREIGLPKYLVPVATLPTIKNAYLLLEDNLIADFGSMHSVPKVKADKTIDANGKMILPSWCDSHTHCLCRQSRAGVCRSHKWPQL
jgi:imidazolonepropionase-like amidohydrolase